MRFDSDFTMTIGGESAVSPETFNVVNPANENIVGVSPRASQGQLDEAVAAARAAFPAWAATPLAARQALVAQLGGLLAANVEPLKRLLTSEQGKSHADAAMEIMGAALWCQSIATQDIPETINEDSEVRLSRTRHVPLGVVAAISPWNYPLMLSMWKVAAALCAGNTIVLKPSPFTPLTCLKMGELARELLPPGVLNVIAGGDELGPWLTSHAGIDKIAFTGSTATGKKVMETASRDLKRVTLELGGNDAAIVMPDVDLETIAPQLFWSAFTNNAQLCVASKRMYVHADIYARFKTALVDYAKTVKVGDGAEQGAQLGPVQNRAQYDRVIELLDDAKAAGLTFLMGGDPDRAAPGYFVPITIIDNPPDDARVVREEAFGPILPLLKFDDIDDVVRRANDTIYGLAGSVWSRDLDKALEIASRLQTGTVWINEAQHLWPNAPFAGHKQSGMGVENGIEGLLEYTVPQTITIKRTVAA
ncbi:MAG TPA: aldehyde dehydrogenase family protein [Caulobacteraceae bacterium]